MQHKIVWYLITVIFAKTYIFIFQFLHQETIAKLCFQLTHHLIGTEFKSKMDIMKFISVLPPKGSLKLKVITYQQPVNEVSSFWWKIIWKPDIPSYNSLENKPFTCIFERRSSWKHLIQGTAKCPDVISVSIYSREKKSVILHREYITNNKQDEEH